MAAINPAKTVELAVIFVFLPFYYLSLNNTDNNSAGSRKDNIFFLEGIKQVWIKGWKCQHRSKIQDLRFIFDITVSPTNIAHLNYS